MDELTRQKTLFAMSYLGIAPITQNESEDNAVQLGQLASNSVTLFVQTVKVLKRIDKDHPELGIFDEMKQIFQEAEESQDFPWEKWKSLMKKARPFARKDLFIE